MLCVILAGKWNENKGNQRVLQRPEERETTERTQHKRTWHLCKPPFLEPGHNNQLKWKQRLHHLFLLPLLLLILLHKLRALNMPERGHAQISG